MRRFKQFIYGIFYLAVLGGIVFSLFPWLFKAGTATTGTEPKLSALEISEQPYIFHPSQSGISVMVQVQNPNSAFAAESFPYKFYFRDSQGKILHEVDGDSFIYASEIKYVAEFNMQFADAASIASVDFSAGESKWIQSSLFGQPDLKTQNLNTSSSESGVQVTGNLINNGTVAVPRVTILAVFYGNLGKPAGISKTELDGVGPGEQKFFSISHPPIGNLNPQGTKIYLYGD